MKTEKNQHQCPRCKEVLTSAHAHDLQRCSCGALAVDGGENLRVIEVDATAFTDDVFKKFAEDFMKEDWNPWGYSDEEYIKRQENGTLGQE